MERFTNEELVVLGREGDPKAFNILLKRMESLCLFFSRKRGTIVGRSWETLEDQENRNREAVWKVISSPDYFDPSRGVKLFTLVYSVLETEFMNNNRVQMRSRERAKRYSPWTGEEEKDFVLETKLLAHPVGSDFQVKEREFWSLLTRKEKRVVRSRLKNDSKKKIRNAQGYTKKALRILFDSIREKFQKSL